MLVKDHYQGVIREIMQEHCISRLSPKPSHVLPKDVCFREVVQYTDSYVGEGVDDQPHYRYRRYSEMLRHVKMSNSRKAHIDIGCGAGEFSWALVDYAIETGAGLDSLEMYGFDHNPEMISLAQDIGGRLKLLVPDYPDFHYYYDLESFWRETRVSHREGSDYIITFGHVLAQANYPDAMAAFTQIIIHVGKMMDTQSDCTLVAVDAKGWSLDFQRGWDSLRDRLQIARIGLEEIEVPKTPINDSGRAKIAMMRLG